MKQRKMPLRKCTGCGEMKEKRELIRVVKAPDTKDENGEIIAKGEISLDLTGRKAGRGAYVCRNLACFEKARKARRFERSLSCKMPLRKCTGCGEMKEKRELIRVVKAPDTKDENGEIIAKGEISLDLTGRKAGRGAYVCRNLACFEKARKARRFERSLSCKIPDEVYEQMQSELAAADSE